jgi:hypothetical protein
VIVRIMTEGQYRLTDDVRARVNELDNACVEAVERGDEQAFQGAFERLLELVRTDGIPLDADELQPSDVLIPPPDTSLGEAERDFSGEGLIPEA